MKQPIVRVLAVVGLAVFLSVLDLFIVNIAFPDLRRDFAGIEPLRALVGADRLRDRLRRRAGAGRAAR